MLWKFPLLLTILVSEIMISSAQVVKVKRKGVQIIPLTTRTNNNAYTFEQLRGKCQELNRKDNNGKMVSFQDTLCYTFSGTNEVFSRDGVNMSLRGNASMEPGNVLIAAADVFTIKTLKNNYLVMDDGEYNHTFIKRKNFWYESLPSATVQQESFTEPISSTLSVITGKWMVFRRDAKPGTSEDHLLIRTLIVNPGTSDQNAEGEVTFYESDKSITLPCKIQLQNKKIIISTNTHKWDMSLYKADSKELVFGSSSLLYYCKKM